MGAEESLSTLAQEYECGNEVLKKKASVLSLRFPRWRRVNGDGNCFYRAVCGGIVLHIRAALLRARSAYETLAKLEAGNGDAAGESCRHSVALFGDVLHCVYGEHFVNHLCGCEPLFHLAPLLARLFHSFRERWSRGGREQEQAAATHVSAIEHAAFDLAHLFRLLRSAFWRHPPEGTGSKDDAASADAAGGGTDDAGAGVCDEWEEVVKAALELSVEDDEAFEWGAFSADGGVVERMIGPCRRTVSSYMLRHPDSFTPFLWDCDLSLQAYCERHVLKWGEECEEISMAAFAAALGCHFSVVYLSPNTPKVETIAYTAAPASLGGEVQRPPQATQEQEEAEAAEGGAEEAQRVCKGLEAAQRLIVAHLLYRPGHYDLLLLGS